jgi:RNA polymerase sigma-70 factor (ECF subfamily)
MVPDRHTEQEEDPWGTLARAACGGDMGALDRLLMGLLPRARNLVRYLLRHDRDVDDITQTALLSVARHLGTFEGRGSFTGWVDRIVARATFKELRQRRGTPIATRPQLESLPGAGDPGHAEDYVTRRWLMGLLERLPPEQQAAFVLRHVLELTVPEIAAETGAPVETVRSRLRLARARLRALGASFRGREGEHD